MTKGTNNISADGHQVLTKALRTLADCFNAMELSEGDLEELKDVKLNLNPFMMVSVLRSRGWVVCPPIVGITTEAAPEVEEDFKERLTA